MIAFSGRSPTIRISVPRAPAASFLAPSNESSSKLASCSERGLTCPCWTGVGEVERQRTRNLREASFTCGFFEPRAGVTFPMISLRVDLTADQRRNFIQTLELTALKMASNANPIASVTFAFRSLSLSRTGGTTASRCREKAVIKPSARASKQFAATMTHITFASPLILVANDLASSPISGPSFIRREVLSSVKRSSKASLRSFHLEEARFLYRSAGSLEMISASSAVERGSKAGSSAEKRSPSHKRTERRGGRTLCVACRATTSSITSVCCFGPLCRFTSRSPGQPSRF